MDVLLRISRHLEIPPAVLGLAGPPTRTTKGGENLEVVVPAERYREGLPEWHHPVYDRLLRDASEQHRTGRVESDEAAHMAGSELLVGQVDRLIAVWDGLPARGFGGTADVVAHARRLGVPVQVLWPAGARR
ncbi:hypothetical protein [Kitasatospora sp. MBT66]|uniref:hypothetical protein n=1 Tax=Kitasatospora sp. MBT66 TaxID=1444769 RepID=UPI000A9EE1D3|nr:hypothetical protein [Kitasatospora sp. MBT66]